MIESLIEHARTIADQPVAPTDPPVSTTSPRRPEALFIACSDARIVPTLITGARPGQLFELRNVGNVVPPYHPRRPCGEAATIEYAVEILRVANIVICGHSGCGAVRTLQPGGLRMNAFGTWWWLTRTNRHHRRVAGSGSHSDTVTDPGQLHLLAQREKLRRYPKVARRIAAGQLRIHGWYYDLDTRIIHALQPETKRFAPL